MKAKLQEVFPGLVSKDHGYQGTLIEGGFPRRQLCHKLVSRAPRALGFHRTWPFLELGFHRTSLSRSFYSLSGTQVSRSTVLAVEVGFEGNSHSFLFPSFF